MIAIIGGDMRMVYLSKMMAKENTVITFGQEEFKQMNNEKINDLIQKIQQADSLKNAIKKAEIIIAPIPFSKDGETVYTQFSKDKITIEELIKNCRDKTLIAGAISEEICKLVKNNNVKIIDLMQDESLTVLNTIATAEGAIEVAIRRTQKVIHKSKILVLGFGRVAKVIAQKFNGLSADITCAARKQEAFAWIEAYGYKSININELGDNLMEYDIIINTPPKLILDKNRLQKLKKDCLVIDLASKPGGIDFEVAKELGINYEWALALPGKVAPLTSAEYIKRTIDLILETDKK